MTLRYRQRGWCGWCGRVANGWRRRLARYQMTATAWITGGCPHPSLTTPPTPPTYPTPHPTRHPTSPPPPHLPPSDAGLTVAGRRADGRTSADGVGQVPRGNVVWARNVAGVNSVAGDKQWATTTPRLGDDKHGIWVPSTDAVAHIVGGRGRFNSA